VCYHERAVPCTRVGTAKHAAAPVGLPALLVVGMSWSHRHFPSGRCWGDGIRGAARLSPALPPPCRRRMHEAFGGRGAGRTLSHEGAGSEGLARHTSVTNCTGVLPPIIPASHQPHTAAKPCPRPEAQNEEQDPADPSPPSLSARLLAVFRGSSLGRCDGFFF